MDEVVSPLRGFLPMPEAFPFFSLHQSFPNIHRFLFCPLQILCCSFPWAQITALSPPSLLCYLLIFFPVEILTARRFTVRRSPLLLSRTWKWNGFPEAPVESHPATWMEWPADPRLLAVMGSQRGMALGLWDPHRGIAAEIPRVLGQGHALFGQP